MLERGRISAKFFVYFLFVLLFGVISVIAQLGQLGLPEEESEVKAIGCPLFAPPEPDWCKYGKIISGGVDENGCQLPPKCVIKCSDLPPEKCLNYDNCELVKKRIFWIWQRQRCIDKSPATPDGFKNALNAGEEDALAALGFAVKELAQDPMDRGFGIWRDARSDIGAYRMISGDNRAQLIQVGKNYLKENPIAPPVKCRITGCSGQVCAEKDVDTTCEMKPEYECYRLFGRCEIQSKGQCGWTQTKELIECLKGKPIPGCGNNICEEGEADYCPPCPDGDLACAAVCRLGTCPKDCVEQKDDVTCIFEGSTEMQQCSSEKGECKGVEVCTVTVQGKYGEQVTWKSSCGGYAYTTIDGTNEKAMFKCGTKKCNIELCRRYVCCDSLQRPCPVGFPRECESCTKDICQQKNLPPVIKSISGPPTVLKVDETGRWAITAYDPENGPLSYSIVWGDEAEIVEPSPAVKATSIQKRQTATFTRSYAKAGIYNPTFTVKDNVGLSAQASLSINIVEKETQLYTCTDSDGKDIYTKGTAKSDAPEPYYQIVEDYCFDEFTVNEAFCHNDGTIGFTAYGCTNGCRGGACIKEISLRP